MKRAKTVSSTLNPARPNTRTRNPTSDTRPLPKDQAGAMMSLSHRWMPRVMRWWWNLLYVGQPTYQ